MNDSTTRRRTKPRPSGLRQALQAHTRAAYRDAIFAAAEMVILRDGYRLAKMTDIANTTGVSIGTVYNCFGSKEALFKELIEHHQAQFLNYIEQPYDSDDPLLQLRQFVARAYEFAEQHGAILSLYIRTRPSDIEMGGKAMLYSVPTDDQHRFESPVEHLLNRAITNGQIRNDLPVKELVWALETHLRFLLLDWHLHPDQVSLRQRGDEIVTLFLQGSCMRADVPDSARSPDVSPHPSDANDDGRTNRPCQNDLDDPSQSG